MFPHRYFGARFYADRYFPSGLSGEVAVGTPSVTLVGINRTSATVYGVVPA